MVYKFIRHTIFLEHLDKILPQIFKRRVVILLRHELVITQIVRDWAVSALMQVLLTGGIFFLGRATVDRLLNDGPPKIMSRQLAL